MDDFEHKLLSDDGKWWEFLDEQNQVKQLESPQVVSDDLLDWSNKHAMQQRSGPVGFDFYERCAMCTNPLPPDLTFCLHCGGEPKRMSGRRTYAIVIKEIEDAHALDEGANWITASGQGFSKAETVAILEELPAAFMVTAPKQQVVALCGRLSDIGVYARAFPTERAPINWVREAFESMMRKTSFGISAIAATVLLTVAGLFYSWWFIPLAVLFLSSVLWFELTHYRQRFQVDAVAGLDHASGFDAQRAERAAFLLSRLRNVGVRKRLTVCMMEYYALNQSLRVHRRTYGDVLDSVFGDMHDLLESVFFVSENVVKLERLPPVGELHHKLKELEKSRASASGQSYSMLQEQERVLNAQIGTAQQAEATIAAIDTRIAQVNLSLETLRSKVAGFSANRADVQEDAAMMETILANLDAELDVLGETFEELEGVDVY